MGSKLIGIFLLAVFAGATLLGYLAWTRGGDVDMPASAYVALALGVFFSVAVAGALMGLVFYSSRRGYDERVSSPQERRDGGDPV